MCLLRREGLGFDRRAEFGCELCHNLRCVLIKRATLHQIVVFITLVERAIEPRNIAFLLPVNLRRVDQPICLSQLVRAIPGHLSPQRVLQPLQSVLFHRQPMFFLYRYGQRSTPRPLLTLRLDLVVVIHKSLSKLRSLLLTFVV